MVVTIDIEGSYGALHPWTPNSYLSAIGVCTDDYIKTWVFNHSEYTANNERQHIKEIQKIIDDATLVVGHNLKFDLNWLRSIGIIVPNDKLFCTQVAEYLIRGQRSGLGYSLNACVERYHIPSKTDKVKTFWEAGVDTKDIPLNLLLEYLKQDVRITHALQKQQAKAFDSKKLWTVGKLSFEITGILSETETNGLTIDVEKAKAFIKEYEARLIEIDDQLQKIAGFEFKPTSPQQLSVALYGGVLKSKERVPIQKLLKSGWVKETTRWGLVETTHAGLGVTASKDLETKNKGYYATNKNALQTVTLRNGTQKEFVRLLLERSTRQKVLRTFHTERKDSAGLLDVIGTDGRVHPGFNQTVTVTGRLSSSKPNGQNLPRKGTSPIKKAIKSRNGQIINVDLAQLEWRMCGAYSHDSVIVHEVCNDVDAHSDNAIRFFKADRFPETSAEFKKIRTDAKIFTFGMIYGRTAHGFFKDKKMPAYSKSEWKSIVEEFYAKYKGLGDWQQTNVGEVLKSGQLISPSGRILIFPRVKKFDGSIGPKEQAVYNYPVQSISADVVYVAMVEIMRRLKRSGFRSELILQVHDSLVFDAFEDEVDLIARTSVEVFEDLPRLCKEQWGWEIIVPMTGDVEVGLTYGDVVGYNLFKTSGIKYLYSFKDFNKEGKEKTFMKWVKTKKDILKFNPDAFDIKLIDKIYSS